MVNAANLKIVAKVHRAAQTIVKLMGEERNAPGAKKDLHTVKKS